jgi:hypothetical protein
MSSGHKRMQINTRERAISTDVNRLQSFIAAQRAEHLRRTFDDLYLLDVSNGFATEALAGAAPVTGDVFGGLMVQPVIGSNALTITKGIAAFFAPDMVPDPDDGAGYKVVESDGVTAIGTLTIAANGGGGPRIDVIECSPFESVEEQDNRDIFDPATGLFSPVLVDKVVIGRLAFRVRQGAPGAGYPGAVAGWMPLAIASVPGGGGLTTDDVTFWDVRPLVHDRAYQPHRAGCFVSKHESHALVADEFFTPGSLLVFGSCEGTVGTFKAGGTLFKGTPTASMGTGDDAFIDILNPENQDTGWAPAPNLLWYIWSLFPFDLPRWVRYTENNFSGLGRVPGSMRGICVASMVGPGGFAGQPALPIGLPTSTGLGGSTAVAWMVAAGHCDVATGVPHGFVADGNYFKLTDGVTWGPATSAVNQDTYLFIDNLAHPANARSLLVEFRSQFQGVANTAGYYDRRVAVGDALNVNELSIVHYEELSGIIPTSGFFNDRFVCEIPLRTIYPTLGVTNRGFTVQYNPSAGFLTWRVAAQARIVGWRIG